MRSAPRCVIAAILSIGVLAAAGLIAGSSRSANADTTAAANDVAPLPADPATIPGYGQDPVSLLGPSRLTAHQLAGYVLSVGHPRASVPIEQLAQIFLEEGAGLGVRADLAWAQSIIETGNFHLPDGGQVHPDDNNFAGIGACDSCHSGHRYPSARIGVRAQMQLLRGYADPHPLAGAMIHPPRSYLGIAPTWRQMGHGRWATAPNYSDAILRTYASMLRFAHVDLSFQPPPLDGVTLARAATAPGAPYEPPVREGDGLYLASPNGQVYDVGDARFWGSAVGVQHHGRAVAVITTPHAGGYWVVFADGRVLAFGSAPTLGNTSKGTVAAAPLADGVGYWTVDRDGHVRAFGVALHLEPAVGTIAPDVRIVDIAATRTGRGYWLADSRGRVYPVGDARSFGNAHGVGADDPVVAIAATPWDDGYWLATATGRVFGFGKAHTSGGLAQEFAEHADPATFTTDKARRDKGLADSQRHLVVALRPAPSGHGYWLVTADGMVVGRGSAPDFAPVEIAGVPVLAATSRLDAAPPLR